MSADDPYVYEGTDVLRNRADIRDPVALAEREQFVSFRALVQMQKEPVLGNFDLAHYAAIHKRLFGEVYAWAGENRSIDLWKPEIVLQGKSVAYSPPAAIEGHAKAALARLTESAPGDLREERPTVRLAEAMSALWQAHPYREGNTRTLLAFMEQYARHHKQPLDQALINRVPSETRDALVLATRGQLRPFSQMIQNARYSDEQRAYPLVGRLSADASEVMRLMGSPRLVVPEPARACRGRWSPSATSMPSSARRGWSRQCRSALSRRLLRTTRESTCAYRPRAPPLRPRRRARRPRAPKSPRAS